MESSSDDDAASDAPLGDSCHLSFELESDDDQDDGGPVLPPPPAMSIALVAPAISPPAQLFCEATQEEPFLTSLQEWLLAKRPAGRRSFETPSAVAAVERGNQERLDFQRLVQEKGSDEQKKLWAELSPELGDAFISRLFLPQQFSTTTTTTHTAKDSMPED
jgi:hypothetical protein